MAYQQATTAAPAFHMAPPEPIVETGPTVAQPPLGTRGQTDYENNNYKPIESASPFAGADLRSIKTACEFSLGEYITLQKRAYQQFPNSHDQERLRAHAVIVASDLRALRSRVSAVIKMAEARRWRRWLFGGLIAAIIPAVRKIFRRSSHDEAANDTEHAFRKSKSLIARILDSVHGKSGLASVAFFVLAVLYVFQNEVSLRVARTVSKRLKRLVAKVERGDDGVGDEDMKALNGWRWRVLLW